MRKSLVLSNWEQPPFDGKEMLENRTHNKVRDTGTDYGNNNKKQIYLIPYNKF